MGILTTRVRPTGGIAWIREHDVWKDQVAVKRLIGVVAQRPNLDVSLTAREILLFHGAYFGLDSEARAARAESLFGQVQAARPRRPDGPRIFRWNDATAFHRARHDARSAGSLPRRTQRWSRSADKIAFVGVIREYNQTGKTILLTTQNLEEADALANRLAISITDGTSRWARLRS